MMLRATVGAVDERQHCQSAVAAAVQQQVEKEKAQVSRQHCQSDLLRELTQFLRLRTRSRLVGYDRARV